MCAAENVLIESGRLADIGGGNVRTMIAPGMTREVSTLRSLRRRRVVARRAGHESDDQKSSGGVN